MTDLLGLTSQCPSDNPEVCRALGYTFLPDIGWVSPQLASVLQQTQQSMWEVMVSNIMKVIVDKYIKPVGFQILEFLVGLVVVIIAVILVINLFK